MNIFEGVSDISKKHTYFKIFILLHLSAIRLNFWVLASSKNASFIFQIQASSSIYKKENSAEVSLEKKKRETFRIGPVDF